MPKSTSRIRHWSKGTNTGVKYFTCSPASFLEHYLKTTIHLAAEIRRRSLLRKEAWTKKKRGKRKGKKEKGIKVGRWQQLTSTRRTCPAQLLPFDVSVWIPGREDRTSKALPLVQPCRFGQKIKPIDERNRDIRGDNRSRQASISYTQRLRSFASSTKMHTRTIQDRVR